MQTLLGVCDEFCKSNNLISDPDKCVAIIFSKNNGINEDNIDLRIRAGAQGV